jgi:hypothetical protein
VLNRNDLYQESIHSRRAGSDGTNEVKSPEDWRHEPNTHFCQY